MRATRRAKGARAGAPTKERAMPEGNGDRERIKDTVVELSPDAKKDVATTALQSLGSSGADVKKEVATTALQTLGANDVGAKTEVATTALQTLGSNAVDAKKEIATTAVQTLGANAVNAKKEIATTVLQTLSPEERQEVVGQVHGPTQNVSDRMWQQVIGAFAMVFIGVSGALVAGVFWLEAARVQVLLTLFMAVAGVLVGFISGRASAIFTAHRSEVRRPYGTERGDSAAAAGRAVSPETPMTHAQEGGDVPVDKASEKVPERRGGGAQAEEAAGSATGMREQVESKEGDRAATAERDAKDQGEPTPPPDAATITKDVKLVLFASVVVVLVVLGSVILWKPVTSFFGIGNFLSFFASIILIFLLSFGAIMLYAYRIYKNQQAHP